MKTRDKITVLRDALQVFTKTPATLAFLQANDPKALEQAGRALDVTTTRALMTPEQKVVAAAQRRFERAQERHIRGLRALGIKNGGFGFRKTDGMRVKFTSDPIHTPTGVKIDTLEPSGAINKAVDAFAFRPDFATMDAARAPRPRSVARKADDAPKATPATKRKGAAKAAAQVGAALGAAR